MSKEYEIHHRETGSWGEHDEYWTLVVPEHGAPIIRHERFWGNPYRGEVTQSPPEEMSLIAFFAKHNFGITHDNLIRILEELRIDPNA
jgi:hypothetical protein